MKKARSEIRPSSGVRFSMGVWKGACKILFCAALLHLAPMTAVARVYDWVSITHDDLQVITDPELEFRLRFELIQRAETEIDFVTFDQRADAQIGMPLL